MKVTTLKDNLGSTPGEDGFRSSKTKHVVITAERRDLFVSAKALEEPKSQTEKYPGLNLGEDVRFSDFL
jgi:hypothetical protein